MISNITEKLAAALAFDQRMYSGFSSHWIRGATMEHERTRPLHAALIEAVRALEHMECGKFNQFNVRCKDTEKPHCYRCMALARLRECLGES